jgi:hypothetical protein
MCLTNQLEHEMTKFEKKQIDKAAHGLPVVAMVPIDTPRYSKTPEGRYIIVCPAQTTNHITCETCGLCQRADRTSIVGFRAHGTRARTADLIARRVIPIARGEQ